MRQRITVAVLSVAVPVAALGVFCALTGRVVAALSCVAYLCILAGGVWSLARAAARFQERLASDPASISDDTMGVSKPFTSSEKVGYGATAVAYAAAFIATGVTGDWYWAGIVCAVTLASIAVDTVQVQRGKPFDLRTTIDMLL